MTTAMMAAPRAVPEEERSVAGVAMVWSLVSGLLAGSALSYAWVLIL